MKLYNKFLKYISASLSVCVLLTSFTFADELEVKTQYQSNLPLSQGVNYSKNLVTGYKSGVVNTYAVQISADALENVNFASPEYIHSRKSVLNIINSDLDDGYKAVGAINGDFFNMSTGVPESAFIKNGVIYTSDRDSFCLAKNSDGKFFFDKPSIKITMDAKDKIYYIQHLNKEFSDSGVFMYTDVFSDNTRIKTPSNEIVLLPYEEKIHEFDMAEMMFGEGNVPDDLNVRKYEYLNSGYLEENENVSDASLIKMVITINDKYVEKLDEFAKEKGYIKVRHDYYKFIDANPKINTSLNCVVTQTRVDGKNESFEIPENSIVLVADNKTYGYTLGNFSIGENVTINISGNETFNEVTDAIGTGCMIVNNGEILENTDLSHYKYANPRSAVGIKEDGSLVLFGVDGRGMGNSAGLTLLELANEMKRLGCVYAANLDGGGSTTVKINAPFFENIKTVNMPSDSSERLVSNIIYVKDSATETSNAVYCFFDTYANFVLPSSSLEFKNPLFSDENYNFVESTDEERELFKFEVTNGGKFENGVFSPDKNTGEFEIISIGPDGFSNTAARVVVPENVDKIKLSLDKDVLYVGESLNMSVKSEFCGYEVVSSLEDYTITFDENFAQIDENGSLFAIAPCDELEISVTYGDKTESKTIKIKEIPFLDVYEHWSFENVSRLYDEKVVIGEITDDGAMFFPDRAYTKNEFCVMLSRILSLEQNENTERGRTFFINDESIPEWAYNSVAFLCELELLSDFCPVDENGNYIFDGQTQVSRNDVMKVVGKICTNAPDDYKTDFPDVNMDDANYQYIKNCVYAGIFEGYEDKSLRKENKLTRGEGAAVFCRISDYLK